MSLDRVEILDPQPHPFHQAHPGAVEQSRHQSGRIVRQRCQQALNIRSRQDRRQSLRLLGPDHALQPRQVHVQHIAVEKQQRRQGQILRVSGDVQVDRQMRQKGLDIGRAERPRVALVVEKDVASNPVQVGRFGAETVVAGTDHGPDLIQQTCGF